MTFKQTLYVLRDDIDGYNVRRIYIDHESAEIGLNEHYQDSWIYSGRVKIEQITAVSYFKKEGEN